MSSTSASGCGAESVTRAGRPSPSCPIGWRRPGTTACTVGNSPAIGSPPVSLPSKQHPTAKIRHACPIHPSCADGHNGDCSACGFGSGPELKASTFCGHPPSLPGIWARSAVFCRSRQEVREPTSSRPVEARDSSAGISAGSGLAAGPASQPRSIDGTVSAALRSQTKLPGGSWQEPVLLLRLWPRR